MNGISLYIAALTEGFLIEEEAEHGKKYALSTGMEMIEKVREIFGLKIEEAPATEQEENMQVIKHPVPEHDPDTRKHLLVADDVRVTSYDTMNTISYKFPSSECSSDDVFIFQECEWFNWQSIPEKKFGKTTIYQSGNSIRITREGYQVVIWSSLESLKRLMDLHLKSKKYFKIASGGLSNTKRTILRACLTEIDLSKLDGVDDDDEQAEAENNKSARIERLRVIAREKQDKWRTENAARAAE